MNIKSFNKDGDMINTKDILLDNEYVYKIIKKYL